MCIMDALNFYNHYSDSATTIETVLKDGEIGIKLVAYALGIGGIYSSDGRIVSFWYD